MNDVFMSKESELESEWREGITTRLTNLETIKEDVSRYHIDVMRLINDETQRRRDALDLITARVNEAHTAVRTVRWIGAFIAGCITLALAALEHFRKT